MATAQARRTHCRRGHPYNAENTCVSNGRRHCLTCGRIRRAAKAKIKPTLIEKIWTRIRRDPFSACWLWTGTISDAGYGMYSGQLAHRLVYELLVEPVPDGLVLDHVRDRGCIHRHCVNPAHLEPVPTVTNVMRGDGFSAVNARKTQCPRGHPYDEQNTGRKAGSGHRYCRACNRERSAALRGGDAQ